MYTVCLFASTALFLPVSFWCPVPLPPIFEPIWDLSGCEPRRFCQFPLLSRTRIRVMVIPFAQHLSRLLLEAVWSLFPVPDRSWQRKLSPDSVLSDGSERPTPHLFRFYVMGFHPKHLKFGMVVFRKLKALYDSVHFFKVAFLEIYQGFRFQNTLVAM